MLIAYMYRVYFVFWLESDAIIPWIHAIILVSFLNFRVTRNDSRDYLPDVGVENAVFAPTE